MTLDSRLLVLPAHQLDPGGAVLRLQGVEDVVVPPEVHLRDLAHVLVGVDEHLVGGARRQQAPEGGGSVLRSVT